MCIENPNDFSLEFQTFLDGRPPLPVIIQEGGQMLAQLLKVPGWLNETLIRLVTDGAFLKSQYQSVDANDIILYRSPKKSFSVRAFIWEPGIRYPIHDHGAWGLVGAYINQIRERKYQRIDDGQNPYHAQLEMVADAVLNPTGLTHVLPVNDGIHQMETVNDRIAVTVHVYGEPVRKGFIQIFDPHFQSVHRIYPPEGLKRALAIRTLASMGQPRLDAVLQDAASDLEQPYMREEIEMARTRWKIDP